MKISDNTTSSFLTFFRNLSLKSYLSLIFGIQIFIAVSVTVYFTYFNTAKAIDDMAFQLQNEISQRVYHRIAEELQVRKNIVYNIIDVENSGVAPFSDLDFWGGYLWDQLHRYPKLTGMGFATKDRDYISLLRSKNGGLVLKKCSAATGYDLVNYRVDERPTGKEEPFGKVSDYDGRKRPQYQAGANTGQPRWSEFSTHLTSASIFTTFSHPVFNSDNELKGVVFGIIFVTHLSEYLQNQKIGKTGQIFLIEDSGNLIATSTGEAPLKVKDNKATRLHVSDSSNGLTKASFQILSSKFSSTKKELDRTTFDYQGEKHLLSVLPFKDEQGLDWKIVVTLPQKDFMAVVDAGNRYTLFIILVIFLLSLATTLYSAGRFTRPIEQLSESAIAIANGNWDTPLEINRQDEIGKLSTSFNSMTQQLRKSVEGLENTVQERTAELRHAKDEVEKINLEIEQKIIQRTAELSEALQSLEESEERFNLAMDATTDGLWDWDMKTGSVYYSSAWGKILAEDSVLPEFQTWESRIHADDKVDVVSSLQLHLNGKLAAWQKEHRLKTRHGDYKWVLGRGRVVEKDSEGQPARMVGTMTDISERKITEEALIQSEARLKEAQFIAKLGNFEHDFEKDTLWWSDQTYEILGFKIANTPPKYKTFIQRLPEDDQKRLNHLVERASTYGEDYSIVYRYQIPEDDLKFVEVHAHVVFDDKDKPRGIKGTVQDITEQRKIQAERDELQLRLIQSQKLESIGNLAGGIAHDFNNILSSIIGYTEIALEDATKDSTQKEYLKEVLDAGNRAKDLVKQILAFARQSDEKRVPVQPATVAREVLTFIRSTIPVTIQIEQSIESESWIMGNSTQLHQVLMNLCTNAANAMEDSGGILKLSLRDTFIDKMDAAVGKRPGDYVEIEVSDNGVGIAPGIIDAIFEPYFTTKGPGEGTGLGLAMVQGLIDSYGGTITVDSHLGKGTTFTIYLPVTKERKNHGADVIEILPTGSENILFVDDEFPIAKMASQILERLGYSVTTRTSSIEALELFRSKPDNFDLVITDMTMPNMTGDKLAIELMKIRSDIPVVLCTGYSKQISEETALEIGIRAFAYKPVVKAELAKTIRKVLDKTTPSH